MNYMVYLYLKEVTELKKKKKGKHKTSIKHMVAALFQFDYTSLSHPSLTLLLTPAMGKGKFQ